MECQNWTNFRELKTWILHNFKHKYVIKGLYNQVIRDAETMFTNHNTKDIYEKKIENGSGERKNITRNNIK